MLEISLGLGSVGNFLRIVCVGTLMDYENLGKFLGTLGILVPHPSVYTFVYSCYSFSYLLLCICCGILSCHFLPVGLRNWL